MTLSRVTCLFTMKINLAIEGSVEVFSKLGNKGTRSRNKFLGRFNVCCRVQRVNSNLLKL